VSRFKYFFIVFSVFALLLSFSAVDVKAQPGPPSTPGTLDDEVVLCTQFCNGCYFQCKAFCHDEGPGPKGDCTHYCLATAFFGEESCLGQCALYDVQECTF
jgi:hypothetical protein